MMGEQQHMNEAIETAVRAGEPLTLAQELAQHEIWATSIGTQGTLLSREDIDFRGTAMSGLHLSGAEIPGANMTGVDCSGTDFYGCNLASALFTEARMPGANLGKANLDYATLDGALTPRANFLKASFFEASALRADLSFADLRHTWWKDAVLADSNLTGACLTGAHFDGCDLRGVNWTGVSGVDGLRLTNVRLSDHLTASDDDARAWVRHAALDFETFPGPHLPEAFWPWSQASWDLSAAEMGALLTAGGVVQPNATLASDLGVSTVQLALAKAALTERGWLMPAAGLRPDVVAAVQLLAKPERVLLLQTRERTTSGAERVRTVTIGQDAALTGLNWVDESSGRHHVQQAPAQQWPLAAWYAVREFGQLPVSTPTAPAGAPPVASDITDTAMLTRMWPDGRSVVLSWFVAGGRLWRVQPEPAAPTVLSRDALAQAVFELIWDPPGG